MRSVIITVAPRLFGRFSPPRGKKLWRRRIQANKSIMRITTNGIRLNHTIYVPFALLQSLLAVVKMAKLAACLAKRCGGSGLAR